MDYRMPLYIQLQDSIIKKIDEKKYLPGEAIPSERKMAEAYGVNRMTVKRAISILHRPERYVWCSSGSYERHFIIRWTYKRGLCIHLRCDRAQR